MEWKGMSTSTVASTEVRLPREAARVAIAVLMSAKKIEYDTSKHALISNRSAAVRAQQLKVLGVDAAEPLLIRWIVANL